MFRVCRPHLIALLALLCCTSAWGDGEPTTRVGQLRRAEELVPQVDELLGRTPPAFDQAEEVAARILDLREAAGLKPPHLDLGAAYLLLARVHERRAGGRPRIDYLDPTLAALDRAIRSLDAQNPAHVPLLAEAHQGRGRVLRTAWRAKEAWQAYVEAVALLARLPDVDDATLRNGIGMALEALSHAPTTPAARSARRGLAPHARRVLQAASADALAQARAHELLGACLGGSREHDAEVVEALGKAAAAYEKAGDALRQGWAEIRLAQHQWHAGNTAACKATFERGRARIEANGYDPNAYAAASDLERWNFAAFQRFKEMAKGEKPAWLLRDDLPGLLTKEGRIAEAWWVHEAAFFLDLAPAHSEVARSKGGRPLAAALHLEAMVRATFGDLTAGAARLREALRVLPGGEANEGLRSRIQFDLGITEHFRWKVSAAAQALEAAVQGFERRHGLAHTDTLGAAALLAVVRARGGDVAAANALADRLLGEVRTNGNLRSFLDARERQAVSGMFVRGLHTLCEGLGRSADTAFVVQTFDPELRRALSQGAVSTIATLRDEGRYRELVERLRRPTYALIEADVPGGLNALQERAPGFLGIASSIRLCGALLDVGFPDEAYAAGLDASDGLSAVLPDELFLAHFLHADLRASTLLARVLLERGLVPEALAVARRAHRLQTLIPDWLRLEMREISSTWRQGPDERAVPASRPTEHRRWQALSEARASEVLARALEATGEPGEALAALGQAVAHVRRHLGPQHRRVGELLHARGGAAFRLGRLEEAREDEEAALVIARAVYGDAHPAATDVRLSLADLDLAGGRLQEARRGYESVLRVADEHLEPWHLQHVRARSGLALALAHSGKAAEALVPMREALARVVQRVHASAVGATQPERLALLAASGWVLANWLEVSRAAGADGYDEVLSVRGLAGRLRAADERAWRREPAAREDHEALRSKQRQLARLARIRGGSRWQRLAWRREVAGLQQQCAELTRKLTKASDTYRKQQKAREVTSASIAKNGLRKGEALVDVLDAGGHYTAWVLARGAEPARIELGPAEPLEEAIAAFREAVIDEHEDPAVRRETAQRVRTSLWVPVEQALPEGTTTVYLVPGGDLPALPLAALPGRSEGSVLAEELLLVHLSTPHALLPAPEGRKPTGRGFVTVGDVDYDEAERDVKGERVAITRRRLTGLRHGLMRRNAQRLETSGPEATWVEKMLRTTSRVKGKATSLRGKQATESRLRETVPGKALLHLATHAVVRDGADAQIDVPAGERFRLQPGLEVYAHRFDPMLMSGVLLAGVNPRVSEGEDDGMLTALEAAQLDLDAAELVVLSACSSAQGLHQSAEGTVGLVRGFRLAGARNVVGSLWKVYDEPTEAWMHAFYERWLKRRTVSAAEALRQASLAMRRGELGEFGRQPRNWAAFVAYGPLR